MECFVGIGTSVGDTKAWPTRRPIERWCCSASRLAGTPPLRQRSVLIAFSATSIMSGAHGIRMSDAAAAPARVAAKRGRCFVRYVVLVDLFCALVACKPVPEGALGTLERDRISLPAPVSERIATIAVREGDAVRAGELIVELESQRSQARLQAAQAEVARLQSALAEARNGPREDQIGELRARVSRAEALAVDARKERERIDAVVARGLLPRAERDRARAAAEAADADVRATRSALAELQRGTREETIAQAQAALAAAQANAASIAIDLERVRLTAPRDGTVDSLPYRIGDQLPAGTPLAVLLVGPAPYARIYVPQPLRTHVHVGSSATVFVHGDATPHAGRVRAIRSEPSFTPYYALSGEDASRLSWLAEVELGTDAAALPVGLPVRAQFPPP